MAQTGLQWLSTRVFPSFLGGLVGRWLVLKLINLLRDRGLVPKKLYSWLFKPVKPLDTQAKIAAVYSDDQISQQDVREFTGVLDSLGSYTADKDLLVVGAALSSVLKAFRIPTEDEIEDVLDDVSEFIPAPAPEEPAPLIVAMERRSPSPGVYPRGIAKKAQGVWDDITTQFSFEIKGFGERNPLREWAVAILIFQRAAYEKGVRPYISGVKPLSPSPQEIQKKMQKLVSSLDAGFILGKKKLRDIQKRLLSAYPELGEVGGLRAETATYASSGLFSIRFFVRFPMEEVSSATKSGIREKLKALEFVEGPRSELKYAPHSQRWRLRMEREDAEEWRLFLVFPFTESEAAFLTRVRNRGDILRELTRLGRKWKQDQRFPQGTLEIEEGEWE